MVSSLEVKTQPTMFVFSISATVIIYIVASGGRGFQVGMYWNKDKS